MTFDPPFPSPATTTPQRCDIGDASRGSLSSYAYILMVLYFLQQREPPVIPVLQEVSARLLLWPPPPKKKKRFPPDFERHSRCSVTLSDFRRPRCPAADGGRLERILLRQPRQSRKFCALRGFFFCFCFFFRIFYVLKCEPVVASADRSIDSCRSRRPTRSRWGSCGWASCASTRRSLTSRSTSSASGRGNASPPSRSSGPANASPSKVRPLSRLVPLVLPQGAFTLARLRH